MRDLSIESRMRILGWYQIAGGVYGYIILAIGLFRQGSLTGANFLPLILALILFSFSIYCGNLLRNQNQKGLSLSVWNQFLQILQIGVLSVGFGYYSGIRIAIGFRWIETFMPNFSFSLSGLSLQYAPSNTSELSIWINIMPFIVMHWIGQIEKDIEEKRELIEAAQKI